MTSDELKQCREAYTDVGEFLLASSAHAESLLKFRHTISKRQLLRYVEQQAQRMADAAAVYENTRASESPQPERAPAIEDDVVERVASKLWHSTPSHCDMGWSELVALSKDNLSLMATVSEFLTMAKAAIAAMQPAIDKARAEAKAEERARVAEFVRTHDVVLNSHQGHVVVPHTGNLVNMHHQKLAEAIEQGGGDEDR